MFVDGCAQQIEQSERILYLYDALDSKFLHNALMEWCISLELLTIYVVVLIPIPVKQKTIQRP